MALRLKMRKTIMYMYMWYKIFYKKKIKNKKNKKINDNNKSTI